MNSGADVQQKKNLSRTANVVKRYRTYTDWYKTVLPFNRLFDRPTTLHTRNGFAVRVRSVFARDLTVVECVLVDGEYPFETFGLPPEPVVFDLGANIGTFSMLVHRAYPNAHIIAYEPDGENFSLLQANARFAELHREAVAGKTGMVNFDAGGFPDALHIAPEGRTTVMARSLADVVGEKHVDLLKVDIEGAERELLEMADSAVFSRIDRIIMETHGWDDWSEALLGRYGYDTQRLPADLGPNRLIYGERK